MTLTDDLTKDHALRSQLDRLLGLVAANVPIRTATAHSHAAADAACELARTGAVGTIMKGSLHTDELMAAAIDRDTGLRTDRRMSHVFIFDVLTWPD